MKDISICIDCDVIQADGGTRTASITGGFVALTLAIRKLMAEKKLKVNPIREHVAAVSCAIHDGQEIVDVDYVEDSSAQADMNFVLSESGKIVEIQGTAEGQPFSEEEFNRLFALAKDGIRRLIAKQKEALDPQPKPVIKELVIASHNPGKIAEFTQLLAPFGVKVYSAKELNLDVLRKPARLLLKMRSLKPLPWPSSPASTRWPMIPGFASMLWTALPVFTAHVMLRTAILTKRWISCLVNWKPKIPITAARILNAFWRWLRRPAAIAVCSAAGSAVKSPK